MGNWVHETSFLLLLILIQCPLQVSNNDTFMDGIERRAKKAGAPFNASWACLRCMPHTIHLAAIKI